MITDRYIYFDLENMPTYTMHIKKICICKSFRNYTYYRSIYTYSSKLVYNDKSVNTKLFQGKICFNHCFIAQYLTVWIVLAAYVLMYSVRFLPINGTWKQMVHLSVPGLIVQGNLFHKWVCKISQSYNVI